MIEIDWGMLIRTAVACVLMGVLGKLVRRKK